jgi:hypothetical protein
MTDCEKEFIEWFSKQSFYGKHDAREFTFTAWKAARAGIEKDTIRQCSDMCNSISHHYSTMGNTPMSTAASVCAINIKDMNRKYDEK